MTMPTLGSGSSAGTAAGGAGSWVVLVPVVSVSVVIVGPRRGRGGSLVGPHAHQPELLGAEGVLVAALPGDGQRPKLRGVAVERAAFRGEIRAVERRERLKLEAGLVERGQALGQQVRHGAIDGVGVGDPDLAAPGAPDVEGGVA